nr:protein DpdE [Agrobacterium sp. fls2-241-TYG-188a]
MFVRAVNGNCASWGVGKLIGRTGDECSVEYFDSPTAPTILVQIPVIDLKPAAIPEQTRVYYLNPSIGAWEIGRLLDDHGDVQIVQFPNKNTRHLNVIDIHVRWSKPIVDPTPFLASRINESPRFSDGRAAFTRSQVTQRGASLGMSAILSAAIDLESHQIEVVRQVLQDPVQRYLLADEVGLGKTIEAGLLIRQCFLDCGSKAKIVVVVPDALTEQWRTELIEKFYLDAALDRNVFVLPMSKSDKSRDLLQNADMLVVDEAHHLTRATDHPAIFNAIRTAALSAERLLLLSATPILHNEASFLAMLHLLDPDTYRLDDVDALKKRIAGRQELAEAVASLIPENALYLDYSIDVISNLFPDDVVLQNHVRRLREAIGTMPMEDDPELIEAIDRTRAHLSEIYRLDRRILRHRRRNVVGLTPDRAGADIFRYQSEDRAAFTRALDNWRFKEASDLDGRDDGAWTNHYQEFHRMLEKASEYAIPDPAAVDLSTPASIGSTISRGGIFDDRYRALSEALERLVSGRFKCVVFCSDVATADALAKRLRINLRRPVDRHDQTSDQWRQFNDDPDHCVLICDRTAEEGLNLQGGRKVVVHYDTPFNPNRVEQRLGRVDRYGSGQTVRSVVLVCEDDEFQVAWTEYLENALKVFHRSVASLQYLIDQTVRDLIPALFNSGTEALQDLTLRHAGDKGVVEQEFRAIDQQDALDALSTPSSDLVDRLSEVDGDWSQIAHDTTLWLERTLLFERLVAAGLDKKDHTAPFRYRFATGGSHTLIPLQTFMDACSDSVDLAPETRFSRVVKTFPNTFQRRTAISKVGRSQHTRLLRYGDPFLSGLSSITDADDRGRSFAMLRVDPSYKPSQSADVFLRFDFLVEANLEPLEAVLAKYGKAGSAAQSALRRRGDIALAPAFSSIWLDSTFAEVTNQSLRDVLQRPYQPTKGTSHYDINVNPYRWPRLERFGIDELTHWADFCSKSRAAAEAHLRANRDFIERLRLAERSAAEIDYRRLSQLETRSRRALTNDKNSLAFERDLAAAMIEGIKRPHIRLETIGAVFLTENSALADQLGGGS